MAAPMMRKERTGYEEGFIQGCESGTIEGCSLGVEKGRQIASEIGFYRGFSRQLKSLIENDENLGKQRTMKTIESLSAIIDKFPLEDVLSQTLFEDLETIRAKFKQLTSQLGISLCYGDIDKVKGVSF
ncbi:hypothetical protein LOTGIDRAFT_232746 [Lottia gigantea]|uniref:Essential protein Yae1 N-terminal domain-containing protein n=1 Tax=Lottia gigantea TaxID=225164 RepID=V3ZPL1_LOTGI|nr:hypothetical protein LOTGIDRAFT_232746 [Lottia gigantea]ESO93328.1 hypothetical protein LOTGIDRAFT_232746 [Lottia gigantea]